MRILFLAAKLQVYEPFGIMHLSPQLKADGHTVRLTDAETPELLEEVHRYEPQLICYSVCSGSHVYYTALNRWLKAHVSFISVFGGPHPTFHPDLINEDGVDAICRGEGDCALPEFCRQLEAEGRLVAVPNFTVRTESGTSAGALRPLVEDLDELPFLDRELYYDAIGRRASHRVQSFFASRGCPFSCSYCFNHTVDGLYGGQWKRVRVRSPENLIDEIAGVVGRYPTEYVSFRESIFPLNAEWLRRFVPQYSSRIGRPFYCHLRLDLLTAVLTYP